MSDANKVQTAYGAEQIQVLEGLEPVRKRPGMYIGTTGPATAFWWCSMTTAPPA